MTAGDEDSALAGTAGVVGNGNFPTSNTPTTKASTTSHFKGANAWPGPETFFLVESILLIFTI